MQNSYVLGVDFGTDSVRALVVDASGGAELGSAVAPYTRWSQGRFCSPSANKFRQHPADHLEALERAVADALAGCPSGVARHVRGIGVDTTGSSPGPVDSNGVALGLLPEFENDPDALFVLWKDHTAVEEAAEINELAHGWGGTDFTLYSGGVYSSEWFWSKILHVSRASARVREAAFSWMEHCDWLCWTLTGGGNPQAAPRSRCAAGHKAMWHASWDGLPSQEFLSRLDPVLDGIRQKLYTQTITSDKPAGALCPEWAERLGLSAGIPVAVGAFDAHMGAVGAGIVPYALTKVIGTSTCDMLVAPTDDVGGKAVRGICGQVDGSVIPGMVGMEAGQSAFGDVYAWLRSLLCWPLNEILPGVAGISADQAADITAQLRNRVYGELTSRAQALAPDDTTVLALDWLNGRRTPDADQRLTGALTGLSLGSDPPRIFRALVESTAYGARRIAERFESEGVPIEQVIALGGVATQSAYVMQTVSDVMNSKISIAASEQACALGAAMFAATAAGLYGDVLSAQSAMGAGFSAEYSPRTDYVEIYNRLYQRYLELGDFVETETDSQGQ